MPPSSTVNSLSPRRPPNYSHPPSHHVGSPPTSFINPWPSYNSTSVQQAIKKRCLSRRNFVPVPSDRSELVQVHKPDWGISTNGLKATWIGHASFLIETAKAKNAERGLRILLDPVWSERVGPYGLLGPVRFTPTPCSIADVPEVDAVCISHDHYDHLDSDTLKKLNAKWKGHLRYFCGLGIKAVLVGLGIGIEAEQVTEMDWWDGVTLSKEGIGSVDVVCTPAQHRSGRAPWNFDGTLWCSWVVKEARDAGDEPKRLYFSGDTGYCYVPSDDQLSHHNAPYPPCPAFSEIGELYGPFDLALLPIGCFQPRSLISGQHSSPDDSVAIHRDVKSKKSIGMHYGTFRGNLSAHYEPVTEPPLRWKNAAEAEGFRWNEEIGLCDIGETVVV
ncbi:Metallo-hydrolase/oxidoreductase [Lojkania enalia]|uniref:Metallo-hydrolase/oxidoreductase n=1 Tax=Lojkania enalia TaxID=147567 RepID=A0A9P4NBV8_9PLEO|nr:Metallo-hydrolase/oxidoreductase [Didymosphaeria enalia]